MLLLPALVALGACSLLQLDDDLRSYRGSVVLKGRVLAPAGWHGPVTVAAYPLEADAAGMVQRITLPDAGAFEIALPVGNYRLVAVGAAGKSGSVGADALCGEPSDGAVLVSADTAQGKPGVDIRIVGADVAPCVAPPARPNGESDEKRQRGIRTGSIAELDDPIYSSAEGRRGYWSPGRFSAEEGSNIYFLEAYDPAKIPILFVHGAAGSPQDWRYFLAHIDRHKYQPWIYFYPSGAPLDVTSAWMFSQLASLYQTHRFPALCITAHSMGGLVVRNMLVRHGDQLPVPKMLVTLATPWGGDDFAEMGARLSPVAVPSWIDLQPGGRFLADLFGSKLPRSLVHHLFFSYRGGHSLIRPSSDGTVTLASQLTAPAQAEAASVWGFDEDHVSILSSPQTLERYNVLLEAFARSVQVGKPEIGIAALVEADRGRR